MLELKNIIKNYDLSGTSYQALKGISIQFPESGLIAILGPSGCGKTTLLNIIGGLDRPTDGQIYIHGKSTENFKNSDFDTYRNQEIGFVFQSYNLIEHQTIEANVALALKLAGVPGKERKAKVNKALEEVGIARHAKKLPNTLSGGEKQRVSIARALVNNPSIILADEPTGALDSKTSVQMMELLKAISKDKLIILVTHNQELANLYADRIVEMKDGLIVHDYNIHSVEPLTKEGKKNKKNAKMHFSTSLALSFQNLIRKKTRSILSAIAGSIGIIGIALILSLSTGFHDYVENFKESNYSASPLSISTNASDYVSISSDLIKYYLGGGNQKPVNENNIEVAEKLQSATGMYQSAMKKNDLAALKEYIDQNIDTTKVSAVRYRYSHFFTQYLVEKDENGKVISYQNIENPVNDLYKKIKKIDSALAEAFDSARSLVSTTTHDSVLDNEILLKSQYELVGENSRWMDFNSPYEAMIVVDQNNQISDFTLTQLGFYSTEDLTYGSLFNVIQNEDFQKKAIVDNGFQLQDEALNLMKNYYNKVHRPNITDDEKAQIYEQVCLLIMKYALGMEDYDPQSKRKTYTIDEVLGKTFTFVPNTSFFYQKQNGFYTSGRDNNAKITSCIEDTEKSVTLKVVGVMRVRKGIPQGSISCTLTYNFACIKRLLDIADNSEVVKAQQENDETSVLDGTKIGSLVGSTLITKTSILESMGYIDSAKPSKIYIYPKNEDSKSYIYSFLDEYNATRTDNADKINYLDTVSLVLEYVDSILNVITLVLVAVVSISLIVSSLMIAIITHISVLERTKEIGILRSLGARKTDISTIFIAETGLIGAFAGILGILVTVVICPIVNDVARNYLPGVESITHVKFSFAVILILISIVITILAGLIPSLKASSKDPVVALRTNE